MPLSIPAFVQYQSPLVPLRGLWNRAPPEGDYFIACEIDWLVSPPGSCVQFPISGNSPVALSQIVALSVDNALSGADVEFIFPDSAWKLVVPARAQVISPVTTNALMFYANAPTAIAGDMTLFQIHNSMPPPVPIPITSAQNHVNATGAWTVNGNNPVIPAGVNGTLNSASINVFAAAGASAGQMTIALVDGSGKTLWSNIVYCPANQTVNPTFNLTAIALRFVNGVNLVVSGATVSAGGAVTVNLYYSQP